MDVMHKGKSVASVSIERPTLNLENFRDPNFADHLCSGGPLGKQTVPQKRKQKSSERKVFLMYYTS